MTAARKPPKGHRLTRAKIRPGDSVLCATSHPDGWCHFGKIGRWHKVAKGHACVGLTGAEDGLIVARPAARGRDGKGMSR